LFFQDDYDEIKLQEISCDVMAIMYVCYLLFHRKTS